MDDSKNPLGGGMSFGNLTPAYPPHDVMTWKSVK